MLCTTTIHDILSKVDDVRLDFILLWRDLIKCWGLSNFPVITPKQQEIWSNICTFVDTWEWNNHLWKVVSKASFFAGGSWVAWSQRREGMMIFFFLGLQMKCTLFMARYIYIHGNSHYLLYHLLQITFICSWYSQFNPFLQGSQLQIQGPRGFKGSKGELVRSSVVFAIWFKFNTIQYNFICSYKGIVLSLLPPR